MSGALLVAAIGAAWIAGYLLGIFASHMDQRRAARRNREKRMSFCEKCGATRNPKGGCPNEMQHIGEWAEKNRNAHELFRDRMIYGNEFVDPTGKRIDPTTILPSLPQAPPSKNTS
jgi:hypothetical protein